MMWKSKIVVALLVVSGMAARPQQIVLTGKIGGDIRNKAALLSFDGDTLAVQQMERGAFQLSCPGGEGLYRVCIGRYEKVFFLTSDTIRVSGYVDRVSGEADVKLSPIEAHRKMLGYSEPIAQACDKYKAWVRDTLAVLPEDEAADVEIELLVQEDSVKSRAVAELVRQEPYPALAAAVAFINSGKIYEEVLTVYEALPEEARHTQPGEMLARKVAAMSSTANGQLAPDFTVVDTDGQSVSLSQLRGKPVVLDFWASWCGPCKKEMKYLKKVYDEMDRDKAVFVSISLDDTRERWERGCAEEQIEWLSWWDEAGFDKSEVRRLYQFNFIPFCVVLDADGRIVGKNLRRNKLRETLYSVIK